MCLAASVILCVSVSMYLAHQLILGQKVIGQGHTVKN